MSFRIRNFLFSFILFCFLFAGCSHFPSSENASFLEFTNQFFCQEVTSSTISLHYTLEDPTAYDLNQVPISYGNLSTDVASTLSTLENFRTRLNDFHYRSLSPENQLTYQILDSYLATASTGAEFLLYQEPLSVVNGVHSQLPILLSEYPFYSAEDVEQYLALICETDTYFQSVINFEVAKAEAGLFMPDYQLDEIISQCETYLYKKKQNYLYSTFEEKIEELPLSDTEKSSYIETNAETLEAEFFPAYEYLISSLEGLAGKGMNQQGLCYLPQGKSYYEYLLQSGAGTSETIPELQEMTKTQILADLAAMEEVIFPSTSQTGSSLLDNMEPPALLNDLKTKITDDFPEIPSVDTTIKYVSSDMEEFTSPAFYLIPTIDNYTNNTIYINQSQVIPGIQLYTTLAHEGYPGHLYQTVYFQAQDPNPVRSILDFGGYVEGWATYAEMMSYYMAPVSNMEATLLQKNNSLLLGLYAYADMGIHYDGWRLEKMSRFFATYGISDPLVLENIYEMIIGCPGNYAKYYLGYLKIYTLKKEMAEELGSEFSHHDFHKALLDVGPAPFDIVEEYVRKTLL